jgi:hypothetical protein
MSLITLLIALIPVGLSYMWSHSSLPPSLFTLNSSKIVTKKYTVQIPPFGTYAFPPNPLVSLPREYHGWQVETHSTPLLHWVVHPSWHSRNGSTMPIIVLRVHPWIWTLRTPLLNLTLFDNKGPTWNVGKQYHDLWVLCNLYRTQWPGNLFAGQTWLIDELLIGLV